MPLEGPDPDLRLELGLGGVAWAESLRLALPAPKHPKLSLFGLAPARVSPVSPVPLAPCAPAAAPPLAPTPPQYETLLIGF